VPLSENEQRMLEQMERALYEEDPKFATQLKGSDARAFYRKRLAIAAVVFVVGVAALLGGAVAQIWPVGVVGFLIMLGAAWLGVSAWRRIPGPNEIGAFQAPAGSAPRKKKGNSGFMSRAEDRWKKRRDEMGR
jgi:hypothetical protein